MDYRSKGVVNYMKLLYLDRYRLCKQGKECSNTSLAYPLNEIMLKFFKENGKIHVIKTLVNCNYLVVPPGMKIEN